MLHRILGEGYANRIVFQWIPGHCGLVRNEKADRNAKRHAELVKQSDPEYHTREPSAYKSILQGEVGTQLEGESTSNHS